MTKNIIISIRSVAFLTLLTGALYPMAVTVCGQLLFPEKANGSLIKIQSKVMGSSLIAQKFSMGKYFQSRPSASDFGTLPSGGSNLGPTSATLKDAIAQRRAALGDSAPIDMLTTSGSGIDPHVSLQAAEFQIERVVKARGLAVSATEVIREMIAANTTRPVLGFIGYPCVNVLTLNLALDARFPDKS